MAVELVSVRVTDLVKRPKIFQIARPVPLGVPVQGVRVGWITIVATYDSVLVSAFEIFKVQSDVTEIGISSK